MAPACKAIPAASGPWACEAMSHVRCQCPSAKCNLARERWTSFSAVACGPHSSSCSRRSIASEVQPLESKWWAMSNTRGVRTAVGHVPHCAEATMRWGRASEALPAFHWMWPIPASILAKSQPVNVSVASLRYKVKACTILPDCRRLSARSRSTELPQVGRGKAIKERAIHDKNRPRSMTTKVLESNRRREGPSVGF